ncbi:MAG: creatininase family protein [Armatimonadota bacterium]
MLTSSYRFGELTSSQVGEAARSDALIVLPVGTTEEHGPHLPVDTDARIAAGLGDRLVRALRDVHGVPALLMETVYYGYSMRVMQRWPGTVVVRSRVFMDMVFDICCSVLGMGFHKLILMDTHGHHSGAMALVSREVADATDQAIAVISPHVLTRDAFNELRRSGQGGEIHGGEWETSLVLHLSPELVDMSKASSEDMMRYHSDFVAGDSFSGRQRVVWSTWYLQESRSGIYGDPTAASAETGEVLAETFVKEACSFAREFLAHGAQPRCGATPTTGRARGKV